ncbi:hypothetical protein LVD15_21670 [Fulvivirga maritima]|uniref:LA_2272 family surface repeat-containing protein n=1 Tax=Fulvivirga maritima TaxID=2904247 RepID=UPI001F47FB77|nr:hypothetical protein [Fulvivirga maritima]UII25882.1 hypothetical protein LVD15_21670 [Fulvivirga maritima]
MKHSLAFTLFLLLFHITKAQLVPLDINLVPGLGTAGLNHDERRNVIAINLFSGYSDRTLLLQLSGINGNNRTLSRGLHIAGIANITGANLASIDKDYKESLLGTVHMQGIQIGGLVNLVRGDVSGAQISSVFNMSEKEMVGIQLAGLANYVGSFSLGAQVGALANKTQLGLSGLQLTLGKNTVGAEMSGLQVGLFNEAYNIEGKNSTVKDRSGVQIGMINKATKLFGFQIGLFNIAQQSGGTQIGLINLYKPNPIKGNTLDGTAIGLINIGDFVSLSAYADEMFRLNYEISTGNMKNGKAIRVKWNKYVVNALSYSHDPGINHSYGIGYSLKKLYFNRSNTPNMTETKFFGYAFDFKMIKKDEIEIKDMKVLVSGFNIILGHRVIPKLSGVNAFLSVGQKIAWGRNYEPENPLFITDATLFNKHIKTWTGVSLGLMLH